ncbi:hypothetical protein QFZ79_001014 [Arthrobacter sp. V4I6]|nr:hypothetical protein [Arthrobacter sp. V1I7]MDQ0852903.1 hypothetical protein [Arthrobacter sp. V4I6]
MQNRASRGWSVVVKGQAAAVSRTEEVLDTVGLPLFPWEAGRKDQFVRIDPASVTAGPLRSHPR